MMAMESMRCWMWACIAVATPMAPTISVIKLTRLRNVVARLRPWVMMGWVSRKSAIRASGKAFFRRSRTCAMDGRSGCQAKQESLGGAAAGNHETRAVQTVTSHHHAWADVEAAEHAIWFVCYLADDAKRLTAELDGFADFQMQAQQDIV